jgi:NAD(P)-dependent dehydrogenase (short-subunit alcohol dehydrogenase family)
MNDLRDRVCLVTGATHGIGRATAEALAKMGATVLVHGRDSLVVGVVCREISRSAGAGTVSGFVADFSSLAAVRRLAKELTTQHSHLDVLVNNAGTSTIERKETPDGFEWTFGVNHLAPFLLTNLLLDALKKSKAARIVNVASMAYRRAQLDFDDLQAARKKYSTLGAYGASKLANILFTLELARRLEGTSTLTANCLHPGVVATNIFRNLGTIGRVFTVVGRPFMLSPKRGAETSIYLASSPNVAKVSGKYFDKCKEAPLLPHATDMATAGRLWEVSERLTGLAQ